MKAQNLDILIEQISKGKIITSDQVDKFLDMVLKSLSVQKKELDKESKERMSEMKEVMRYIEVQHKEILKDWNSKLDSKSQKTLSDFTSKLDKAVSEAQDTLKDVKQLLEDVQSIELKEGKDADEELIVEKVIDRIKIEPDVVTLSGDEIKKKLSALKGDKRLDAKSIKGFELYSKKVDLDYAVRTLQQQTSFLINRVNSSTGSTIVLTTVGTSGPATFDGTILNIPNYSSGSGGITRTIQSKATDFTAGSTSAVDYVYLVTGTTTATLPTAVGNTNRYTIKKVGTNTVTIATTGGQTIDGSSTASILVQYVSLDLISDGTNWNVI